MDESYAKCYVKPTFSHSPISSCLWINASRCVQKYSLGVTKASGAEEPTRQRLGGEEQGPPESLELKN